MSDIFGDEPRDPMPAARPAPRRSRALIITGAVLVVGFFTLTTFASIYTDRLWFRAGGYPEVFSTMFWTRTGLFLVFGSLMALVVGANMVVAYRLRPLFRPSSPEQTGLDRYRDAVTPVRTWLLVGVSLVVGLFAGTSGAGHWRSYLLWRNGVPFGQTDKYFNRDIGFYVFDLPWLHYLVDFTMAVTVVALLASVAVHYLYGGVRLQTSHDRLSGAAQAQFSVLLGVFVLAKAADYWLDRFDLVNQSGRLITGYTYTDDHAVLPAKNILVGIAIICAVLFFLNVWRRTWLLPSVGLALLVLSAVLLGMIWPGIVQQFQVDPTEADKEETYIAANIDATRDAYDVSDVVVKEFTSTTSVKSAQPAALDGQTASVPLVDPQLVHAAFEQQQQARAYYSVADVLDVDRYQIEGKDRAMVLGVRELDQAGISQSDRNWSNLHTVYTHGNGVIAAFANQRPANDSAATNPDQIQWAEGQQPDEKALSSLNPGFESRIYYGEQSPDYSIVGKTPDGPDVELNLGTAGGEVTDQTTTYDGKGGVDVGGVFHQLLYAVKFGDPNFLLSARVGSDSKVLYNRNPRDQVEKVAPWLTVDSDPYPVVVDGRILWVVDGYTTTDRYPLSQRESFKRMTDDSLNTTSDFRTLPTDEINYMRNAVKATVDAYDGTVNLYAWDETDPILKAWRSAFPGTVKDKAEIPESLISHLRYPEDLFKVQRYQFARYHVKDPKDFYQGSNRWAVPEDPYAAGRLQPPYRLFVNPPGSKRADEQVYSLTSVYVPSGKSNLAAFVSVDSDATDPDNYGKMRVLQLPTEQTQGQLQGPGQVASEMTSSDNVQAQLFKFNSRGVKPIYGNLLTLPVGDGLMYVQPVYTTRQLSSSSFPILTYVLVSYGGNVGIGKTLPSAIADVLGVSQPSGNTGAGAGAGTGGGSGGGDGGQVAATVRSKLRAAEAAFERADAALRAGDSVTWAQQMERGRRLVASAVRLAEQPKAPAGD